MYSLCRATRKWAQCIFLCRSSSMAGTSTLPSVLLEGKQYTPGLSSRYKRLQCESYSLLPSFFKPGRPSRRKYILPCLGTCSRFIFITINDSGMESSCPQKVATASMQAVPCMALCASRLSYLRGHTLVLAFY